MTFFTPSRSFTMQENLSINEIEQALSLCLDEIIKLKEENQKLSSDIKILSDSNKKIIETFENMASQTNKFLTYLDFSIDNVRFEANDPALKSDLFYPNICSLDITIDRLKNGASMSRFGDGEFALMENSPRPNFQSPNNILRERLIEVINSSYDDLLIGIADNYGILDKYNNPGVQGIRTYMTSDVRRQHRAFLSEERVYHNAYITRPYALYRDNHTDAPRKRFDALQSIWNKRSIIFVEGNMTRLGYNNDLFSNASEIKRVECPNNDAFDKYEEILSSCLKFGQSDSLFIIALGPTATVLAYDLYKAGYQAIDLGHLDLEYEWFLNNKGTRSMVPYKYNNEFVGGNIVEEINDPTFNAQIVDSIL